MANAGLLIKTMIKGIGVDIIEISRIFDAVKHFGDKFLDRVYTKHEQVYCKKFRTLKFPELAVRFAAKEAYAKALGTGMRGIHWKQIGVVNDKRGKPQIAFESKLQKNVHISLSHSDNFAVAYVVIEENEEN